MSESVSGMTSNDRDFLIVMGITAAAFGGLALHRKWRKAQREKRLLAAISIGVTLLASFVPVALG